MSSSRTTQLPRNSTPISMRPNEQSRSHLTMNESISPLSQRISLGLFLGVLAFGVIQILAPFTTSVVWAGILGYVTWPLFVHLDQLIKGRTRLAALLMVFLIGLVLVMPFIWLIALVHSESTQVLNNWPALFVREGPLRMPEWLASVPLIGLEVARYLDQLLNTPSELKIKLLALLPYIEKHGLTFFGSIGSTIAKLGLSLFVLFFVFVGGQNFMAQSRRILTKLMGDRARGYLDAVGKTTRGVVYGIVLTAFIQGLLAGAGYWATGVPAPATLAAVTAFIALIPFGTPFVWGSAAVWLWFTGQIWPAIGLTLWGVLVISWVDNLVRPMALAGSANIPFLLALFGVLGGLSAFGVIGLFVGPVILAVALTVWREWLA